MGVTRSATSSSAAGVWSAQAAWIRKRSRRLAGSGYCSMASSSTAGAGGVSGAGEGWGWAAHP